MSEQATNVQELERHECPVCGYIYEPQRGIPEAKIPPGTAFENLPAPWRCPVCGVAKTQFKNIGPGAGPSGFKENLKYGLGVNSLTPPQKNLLIFSGLVLAFLLLISLYGLQ